MGNGSTAVTDRVVDLVGALNGALVATGSSQRQLLAAIAGLDHEDVWERDGHRDMAEWVSANVGIS
ncbi:MAG: hypothetical protein M3285_01445, partial [Actinomycetota bacterium]|nr:hypothetical protein [Actinomycetota bacterium]